MSASRNSGIPVPKRVLVIGGGPTGLVALRNFVERGHFDHVELYERRNDVGGVWYFEEVDDKPNSNVPHWPSPAYRGLIGNVLPTWLSYSEFPFPEPPSTPHQPFPTLVETHAYLQSFAAPYLKSGHIKVSREVVSVVELRNGGGWEVFSRDWTDNGREICERWDAVAVAVGWYDNPVWPDTEGLSELIQLGLAKHAKWWRGPHSYGDKKMLVVGNANSANDIAAQLAPVADGPVYQSIRRPAYHLFPSLPDERIRMVGPVAKYILKPNVTPEGDPKFDAVLADGTILADLDSVQVGTGYRPLIKFIQVLKSSASGEPSEADLTPIVDESTFPYRIPALHRLVMYAHNPSLGFIGAMLAFTPFSIADLTSTWLALAWRGETSYPGTVAERLVFEKERLESIEAARREVENPSSLMVYSILGPSEQGYATDLRSDVVQARPELDKIIPLWNDARTQLRESMYMKKFTALQWAKKQRQYVLGPGANHAVGDKNSSGRRDDGMEIVC